MSHDISQQEIGGGRAGLLQTIQTHFIIVWKHHIIEKQLQLCVVGWDAHVAVLQVVTKYKISDQWQPSSVCPPIVAHENINFSQWEGSKPDWGQSNSQIYFRSRSLSSAMAPTEGSQRWYFSDESLANSPSRRNGVSPDKEESYRQQAANFIQDMGQRLQV